MLARKISFFALILLLPQTFFCAPSITLSPGEVLLVETPLKEDPGKDQDIECDEQKWTSFYDKEKKRLLFYISENYFSTRKSYPCFYKGQLLLQVSITEKNYPLEKLKVPPKTVSPSKKDLERIKKEMAKLKELYEHSASFIYELTPFINPLNSKITSFYGTKRELNGQVKTQHLGIDFRAPIGTVITASQAGKVVLAEDLFYSGQTVIVDHGLSLFTLYGHLSRIHVKVGDIVKQGQKIGLSGKSGRITGPHLHWGVKVQGNWVNGENTTHFFSK